MKTNLLLTTLLAFFCFSNFGFSQIIQNYNFKHATKPDKKFGKNLTLDKSMTCGNDTCYYTYLKEEVLGTSSYYQMTEETVVTEWSQTYLNTGSLTLKGISFYGGVQDALNPAQTLVATVVLYNVDASYKPTTQITSKTINLNTTLGFYTAIFTTPQTITGNYAVAIKNTSSTDTVAIFTNNAEVGTYNENFAYIKANGSWYTANGAYGNPYAMEPIIAPVISYTINTNFTMSPSATTMCIGTPLTFTNTTTSMSILNNRMYNYQSFTAYWNSATDTIFAWDLGDGSSIQYTNNIAYTYTAASINTVTLYTFGGLYASCIDTKTSGLTINTCAAPTPDFIATTATTINVGESVSFSDLSIGSPTSWLWDFGDGQTSIVQNPTHTYNTAGVFTVSLTVTNAYGSYIGTLADYITVNAIGPPVTHGITSSFGNGIFVEGVYGVQNIFIAGSSETGITQTTFYLLDSTNALIISPQTDFDGIDGWSTTFDMGDTKLNSFVYAEFTDGTNVIDTAIYPLIVREKPDWLYRTGSNVIITSIDTPNRIAEMNVNVGVFNYTSEIAASDNIVGFGEKPFGFTTNLTFQNTYDFNNGTSQVNPVSPILNYDLNIFNQHPYNNGFTNTSPNTILSPSLDEYFNLGLYSKASISKELLNWKSQNVSIPVIGPIKVSFGLGLKLYGGIGAKLIYQKDDITHQYGFLNLGTDSVSEFSVGAKIEADFRGRIDIISKSFASAEGTLTGIGRIGLAYQYWSQQTFGEDIKFGGDFYIKGKIEFYGLASPIVKSFNNGSDIIGPKQLWPSGNSPRVFGDGFPSSIDMSLYKLINSTNHAKTYEANYQYDMSHQAAQPNFGTRGNKLVTTWIEADTTLQYLFFTTLDTIQNCFTPQVLVTSTAKSISNPKTAVFNNGDAIITWTQNRYDVSTVPVGYDISDYLNSQDIMMAIYEASTNSIYTVMPLTSSTYGKAFGEAKVTTGTGNNAMVSWVTQDLNASTSDINYTNISKTGIQWFMTTPDVITYLPGINHKVDIVYADNTNAIACWINNADGNDSTIVENTVYYSSWDGNNWATASPLIVGVHFKDISVGFNNGYGAFGYTANWVDTLGSFHEIAGARVYDYFANNWIEPLDVIDSISTTYNKPVIAVDESGKVSFSIQSVNLFNDTLNPDQGKIVLLLNNLPYSSGWQATLSNLSLLNDTNVFVWTMDADWGANSTLYFLTQETDTIVGNDASYLPVGGVTFGEQSQGLVLRAATVDNNLNLSQTFLNQECMPTGIGKGINSILNDFILKQNVPNPASNFTDIEYRIVNKGNVTLKIYDINGKLVIEVANLFLQPGIYNSIIDVSNLENGVYIYSLIENGISHSKRMIIAR